MFGADWGVHHRSCDAYPLMGGTFDNVDQGAVVWGEYAGFGWLESLGWWCSGFFECILLGPGDPDHGCFLYGG
ncbi:hypothetical protein GCM10009692_32580 [Leucobacter aridicollis]